MTLSPSESRGVIGLDGPSYDLPDTCAVCTKPAGERHHLWRRSDVIGDRWWVYVDVLNKVVGNCIKLCHTCHDHVTDNEVIFALVGNHIEWGGGHHLAWQPPVYDTEPEDFVVEQWKMGLSRDFDPECFSLAVTYPDATPVLERHLEEHDHDPHICYACHRRLPKPKEEHEEKKVRKTWSVAVPVDRREDGADVLDTLIEEARKEMFNLGLPYGSEETAKYYVMAAALGLFVQNATSIMGDS